MSASSHLVRRDFLHHLAGGAVLGVPLNRLVNEAVGEYLEARAATMEAELEETLVASRPTG